MFCIRSAVSLLAVLAFMVGVATGENAAPPSAPVKVLTFQLTAADGTEVALLAKPAEKITVVCFLGTECPLARLYGPRLNKLAEEFAARGVRFVGVNSNSQDSPKDVAVFAKDHGISFPIAKDPGNKVADQFGARRMAEVFVVDQSLAIRYAGRIDDQHQPGVSRGQPTRHDLRMAIEELLAGKPVSVARTETTGCLIGRLKTPAENPKVTYCNQIARVLNQHCVECHRPGEIGPFSLTQFDEVTGWGDTILETIDSGRMPPWNADPGHGKFANARSMPETDKQLLRDWIAAGMPYGDEKQLPPPQTFRSGWQLSRDPDVVLKMSDRPFLVPASGTVEYQYFVVDPDFKEDRWVSAAQVIPGNRGVVHHCIVFVRPPDGSKFRGVGWLTGYVPGQRSFALPPGRARRVPAGSKLVFQMHYTPNGIEQADITQVGINLVPPSEVTHEVFTLMGIDQEFEIPPFASDFPVHGVVERFPPQAELLAIVPHMHVRGKSFQAISRRGDQTEILLEVPRYDFNWQHVYELSTPLKLADIDTLEFTARFDNSKQNPVNPDPSQTVTWGDQTWEEMAISFFEIAEPLSPEGAPEPPRKVPTPVAKSAPVDQPAGEKVPAKKVPIGKTSGEKAPVARVDDQTFVKQFFERFDKNADGVVEFTETPLVFRKYAFHRYDSNGDSKLSREEIESAAQRR